MRMKSRPLNELGPSTSKTRVPSSRTTNRASSTGAYAHAVLWIVCTLALAMVMQRAVQLIQVKHDDLKYGRPRMVVVSAVVGHGDSAEQPTTLTAMNLQRRVVITEYPGDDPSKARTLNGPYLFGERADLTPVLMHLEPINDDELPDLLLSINNELICYINDNGSFRLMNDAERAQFTRVVNK